MNIRKQEQSLRAVRKNKSEEMLVKTVAVFCFLVSLLTPCGLCSPQIQAKTKVATRVEEAEENYHQYGEYRPPYSTAEVHPPLAAPKIKVKPSIYQGRNATPAPVAPTSVAPKTVAPAPVEQKHLAYLYSIGNDPNEKPKSLFDRFTGAAKNACSKVTKGVKHLLGKGETKLDNDNKKGWQRKNFARRLSMFFKQDWGECLPALGSSIRAYRQALVFTHYLRDICDRHGCNYRAVKEILKVHRHRLDEFKSCSLEMHDLQDVPASPSIQNRKNFLEENAVSIVMYMVGKLENMKQNEVFHQPQISAPVPEEKAEEKLYIGPGGGGSRAHGGSGEAKESKYFEVPRIVVRSPQKKVIMPSPYAYEEPHGQTRN